MIQYSKLFDYRCRLCSMAEVTPELRQYLNSGVGHDTALAHCGIIGATLCKFFGGNSGESIFEFAPDGVPSITIEALGADGVAVVDLVSWPIHAPENFATATMEADVLGAWWMVRRGENPLHVFPTPDAWLREGCQGCVPLNPEWAGHWLHKSGNGPLIVDSIEHGREVREMLGRHAGQHQILVTQAMAA